MKTQRTPRRSSVLIAAFGTLAVLLTLVGIPSTYAGSPAASASAASAEAAPSLRWGSSRVQNGSFEGRKGGWRSNGRLWVGRGGPEGRLRATLASWSKRRVSLWDAPTTVTDAEALSRWRTSAYVRATRPNIRGRLRVVQRSGDTVVTHEKKFRITDSKWHQVELELTVTEPGASLDLSLTAGPMRRGGLVLVDAIELQKQTEVPAGDPGTSDPGTSDPGTSDPGTSDPGTSDPGTSDPGTSDPVGGGQLTNGCKHNAVGIPGCSAYFGGATGGNADPGSLEQSMGKTYGVRRTYFRADQVDYAIRTAKSDLAKGRLPWMSFKLPHSWKDMAAGKGDAWARALVDRMDDLDGPVWIAFHHEPENDSGAMSDWRKLQERLGPIVHNRSDNVAFTVILMGWHELYGKASLSFDALWPNTKVDVAGFDIYNWQGTPDSNGNPRPKAIDMEGEYFTKLNSWAKSEGVRWGLAETGYTTWSANHGDKTWIQETYKLLKKHDGVAFSYFNTPLNSDADWTLSTASKVADFKAALRSAPTMR